MLHISRIRQRRGGGASIHINLLDNVIAELKELLPRIDFVKIDVEGFEIFALQGATKTLEKYRPTIIIESFLDKAGAVRLFLEQMGYILIKEFVNNNYLYIHKSKLDRKLEELQ